MNRGRGYCEHLGQRGEGVNKTRNLFFLIESAGTVSGGQSELRHREVVEAGARKMEDAGLSRTRRRRG